MKIFNLFFFAFISFGVLANSVEEARKLYDLRGMDFKNAYKASAIYENLAKNETNELKKAQFLTHQAEAIYYWAYKTVNNNKKIERHEKGYKVAMNGAKLLAQSPGVAKKKEYKTDLARAYYFFGANLGQWGQARGIFSSLGRWSELRKHMEYIIALDKTVEDWGANRILGRGYMKVPRLIYGGSKKKSLALLKEAYEARITVFTHDDEEWELCSNSATLLFYLDILKAMDKVDTFCEVYDAFNYLSKTSLETKRKYSPDRLAETIDDLKKFKENSSYASYYKKSKCDE